MPSTPNKIRVALFDGYHATGFHHGEYLKNKIDVQQLLNLRKRKEKLQDA